MGGIFSSSERTGNCNVLDERTTYLLVRNYIVILKMIEIIDFLNNKAENFYSAQNNFKPYLVDSRAMLELLKEIPDGISTQFSPHDKKLVGVRDGEEVYKTVTFYDSYNDFFLVEQKNFASFDDAKDRLNQILDNLKTKADIVESLINSMCIREIGV